MNRCWHNGLKKNYTNVSFKQFPTGGKNAALIVPSNLRDICEYGSICNKPNLHGIYVDTDKKK